MNESLNAFGRGFIRGVKESPREFFAPFVAVWKWFDQVTDPNRLIGQPAKSQDQKVTSL